MPWTGASFRKRHNHGLSASQAGKAAKQANAILKKTGDEGLSIAVANKNAGHAEGGAVEDFSNSTAHMGSARMYARGGKITEVAGKPIGKDDGLIAAQRGEYVIRRAAVKKLGTKVLDEVNKGRLPSDRLYGSRKAVRHG